MATAADVKTAYRAINRTDLNDLVAQSVADAINSNSTTLDAYIAGQIAGVASTTQAAVAISAFVTGLVPTSAKLDALTADAKNQVASYTKMGVGNPALGAFEAFGKGFALTPEFAAKYGSLTGANFITAVYVEVYGTVPSAAALSSLMGQLTYFNNLYATIKPPLDQASEQAKGAVLGQIVGYAFVSDASANSSLDNRVVATLTAAAHGDDKVYDAPLAPYANPGNTFVLTTGVDSGPAFTGGLGNDIFKAPVDGGFPTLNSLDSIDGGAGVDTLEIANSFFGGNVIAGTIKNIENVSFLGAGSVNGNINIDGTMFSGAIRLQQTSDTSVKAVNLTGQTLVMDRVADGTNFTGELAAAQTSASVQSLAPIGDSTFSLSGAALKSLSIKTDTTAATKVLTVTDTGNTATSATIESSGKSAVTVNSGALETVTAKGDGALTLSFGTQPSKAIDASAAKGGVTVNGQLTNNTLFTGGDGADEITIGATNKAQVMGKGDDTVTVNAPALGALGSADGGDGTDTLAMTAANAATATLTDAFSKQISNFEKLSITNAPSDAQVINLANLDNINYVKSAGTALGTAVKEVQFLDFDGTDANGVELIVGGVRIAIPNNATDAQVAAAVAAKAADIIAANPNVESIVQANIDQVQITYKATAGNVPDTYLNAAVNNSGVTFSGVTEVNGQTGINEVQTFKFNTGPSASGTATITLPGGGAVVNVSLFAGQSVLQVAQAVKDAITAAGLTGITASVTNDTVTVTYANSQGNVVQGVFAAGGATGTTSTDATTTTGVVPAAESQYFTITAGSDATGGEIVVDGARITLAPNLDVDEVGAAIVGALGAIQAADPRVTGIAYDSTLHRVTLAFSAAAGDIAPIAVSDNVSTGEVDLGSSFIGTPGVSGTLGGEVTLNNYTSGGTLELTGDNAATTIVNVKGAAASTTDVFNVILNGASNLNNNGQLKIADVETLNITTTDSTSTADPAAASVLAINDTAAKTITVAGNHGVDFTGSSFGSVTSFDASGVTATGAAGSVGFSYSGVGVAAAGATVTGGAGNDFIGGGAGKDTISGGAGNDHIFGRGGADTLSGGAGNDVFKYTAAGESTLVARDVITDFQANTIGQGAGGAATSAGAAVASGTWTGDVIDLTAFGKTGIDVAVQANAANAQTAIQNAAVPMNGFVHAALDSSTGFLYLDFTDDGVIDSVIQLTGVTTINTAAFQLV